MPPPSNTTRNIPNGTSSASKPLYTPKYVPPPSPPPPPEVKVENHVEVPGVLNIVSLSDITERILSNASTLFPPSDKHKVVTALSPSGLLMHAVVVAPKNEASPTSKFKPLCKGSGVPVSKGPAEMEKARRYALLALLEEVEKRVGKEILGE